MTAPRQIRKALVVGGGTMGVGVAVVLGRGAIPVVVAEQGEAQRASLPARLAQLIRTSSPSSAAVPISIVASLGEVDWGTIDLVVECIPEKLDLKQRLFADLELLARPDTLLTSNSSSFPISSIARGLATRARALGLHFFMPAHLIPLVEVILGAASDPAHATSLAGLMRRCAMVPVIVRKDLPGFLANRLQHALAREVFAMLDDGIASAEDIDAAVRFGFGFRFLAAGPILQRDHAGLEIHAAAAATIYPSLSVAQEPARCLRERIAAGHLGLKTGAGFFEWGANSAAQERARYESILKRGLTILAPEIEAFSDRDV